MICRWLCISAEGHVILSGLRWQLLGCRRLDTRGGSTHTHTQWWTRTHTKASILECSYKDTHTHRYTPVCTFLPHSAITQMLVTAVTGGKEEGGCTNSGLCNAADIELCAFLFGKSTQTMKGQLTAARRLSQFLVFKQNVNSDQERVELFSRHSLFFLHLLFSLLPVADKKVLSSFSPIVLSLCL